MRQRWDWTYRHGRLLLVTSVVTVVLLTAALVTVVSLGERSDSAGPDCVVGRWRVVHFEYQLSAGIGRYFQADDQGPVEEYRADGTAAADYGDGVLYNVVDEAFGGLGDSEFTVSGSATYQYEIDGDVMRYHSVSAQLRQSTELIDLETSISTVPFTYRCDGDTMTYELVGTYQARLVRLD